MLCCACDAPGEQCAKELQDLGTALFKSTSCCAAGGLLEAADGEGWGRSPPVAFDAEEVISKTPVIINGCYDDAETSVPECYDVAEQQIRASKAPVVGENGDTSGVGVQTAGLADKDLSVNGQFVDKGEGDVVLELNKQESDKKAMQIASLQEEVETLPEESNDVDVQDVERKEFGEISTMKSVHFDLPAENRASTFSMASEVEVTATPSSVLMSIMGSLQSGNKLRLSMASQKSMRHSWSSDDSRRLMSHFSDMSLCRGVPADQALRHFGKHWSPPAAKDPYEARDSALQDYALSEQVEALDDFVSHDWGTGRWTKFISLSVLYNSVPAGIIASLVSVTLGLLQILFPEMVPPGLYTRQVGGVMVTFKDGVYALPAGGITFAFVFVFWQRLNRSCCRRRRMLFVDKLCIHQTMQDRKIRGIMSLSAFLKVSGRFVIIWSPRYFQRLWCVYEVASWFQQEDLKGKALELLLPATVVCTILGKLLCFMMFWAMRVLAKTVSDEWQGLVITLVCVWLCVFVFLFSMSAQTKALQCLDEQLTGFKVREAGTFCCSVGHIMPDTDETIPCDRELVYENLRKRQFKYILTGKSSEDLADLCDDDGEEEEEESSDEDGGKNKMSVQQAFLDRFDMIFQMEFVPRIQRRLRRAATGYRYLLVASLPALWYLFDRMHCLYHVGGKVMLIGTVEFTVVAVCMLPCGMQLCIDIGSWIHGNFKGECFKFLVCVLCASCVTLVCMVTWGPLVYSTRMEDPKPLAVVTILYFAVTIARFAPYDLHALCGQSKAVQAAAQRRSLSRSSSKLSAESSEQASSSGLSRPSEDSCCVASPKSKARRKTGVSP
eukprot:TRINITY_DN61328_c0_g2_i1.p1 TRINITY_DN61328_c0_g2~~TRINITY_DN61328_c0_g2_i1.p1  ORF type:complete len:836 (-),score=177.31 TRINITY_DN61328_c0_g2_i1:172-2679(-)